MGEEEESLRGKTVGEIVTGLFSGKISLADVKADMPSLGETFDSFIQYVNTINWKEEYWLQAWLALCVVLLVIIISKRKNNTFVTCAFIGTNLFAFFARFVNSLGAKYWEMFSTRPYFDKEGAFISLVYTFPLLILSFVLLLFLFFNLTATMVELKKKKLVIEMKKKKAEASGTATDGNKEEKKKEKEAKPSKTNADTKKKTKRD